MKDVELIKKFLNGELTQGERFILLEKIEEDTEFTDKLFDKIKESKNFNISDPFSNLLSDGHPEINETRNEFIKSIIQKYGGAPATDDEFEFISVVSKAISRNPPGKRFHNFFSGKFRYWTAASIIVLILIPVGYFSTRKSVDPDDLYKKYFSPVVPLTLRGGANSDSIYYKGVIQYNTGNYKEAIGTFNLIPENHNFALLVDLYKANAYMVLGDYKKALEIMAPILDQGCLFTDDVAWYMALCELKLGQFKKASRHLELVINCYPKPNYPIKLKKALKKKIKRNTN